MPDPLRLSARQFAAIIVAIALVRFVALGAYPLVDTTEGRYGEIPREMVATGDWVTPQLDPGVPFWAKPPLSFWITAALYEAFGVSAFTARLGSWLLAVFCCGLVYVVSNRLRGAETARLATLILATTGLFHILASGVMTDPSLAATVTLSLAAVPMALTSSGALGKHLWGWAFFAGLGLSALAKGPVGWILTLGPLFFWTALDRRLGQLFRELPWFSGSALALSIAVPWHLLAERRTPGFLNYYLVGEHFRRFFVPGWQGDLYGNPHENIRGVVWGYFALASLPWLPLGVASAWWLGRRGAFSSSVAAGHPLAPRWELYFACWSLAPMAFFTPARNTMITYVLPGLPAFAMLAALGLSGVRRSTRARGLSREPWFARPLTLWCAAAPLPLLFAPTALLLVPRVVEKRTQRGLARTFLELCETGREKLVYFDKMPYSGDFYSNGRAVDIPDEDQAKLAAYFDDGELDFFAVEQGDYWDFRRVAGDRATLIGNFGDWSFYRELPRAPDDAPAGE